MKKVFLPLLVILISIPIFSQGRFGNGPHHEKLEQLERLKLLEVLDLDEETSIRFFSRRSEHRNAVQELVETRGELIREMEESVREGLSSSEFDYESKIEELLNYEGQILESRREYIDSIKDILSPEQIAKVLVVESRFMREVRETLIRRGRGRD